MPPRPQISFPCRYPIKVMARASGELRATLDAIFELHTGSLAGVAVSERPSAQGNFTGYTYHIEAQSAEQVAILFEALKAHPAVLMVL